MAGDIIIHIYTHNENKQQKQKEIIPSWLQGHLNKPNHAEINCMLAGVFDCSC